MNITLKTPVKGNYLKVIKAFDRTLFEALKPSLGQMEIVSFDGSQKGNKVHIRFLKPVKADWISEIVEDKITDNKAWFVDIGRTIPWPLQTWKHAHIVEKIDDHNSMVIDDINFTGKNIILTLLLYPAILFGFLPRKNIYKSYFKKLFSS